MNLVFKVIENYEMTQDRTKKLYDEVEPTAHGYMRQWYERKFQLLNKVTYN